MKFSLYTFQVYRLEYCFGDTSCREIGYKPWFFYFLKFVLLAAFVTCAVTIYTYGYNEHCTPTYPQEFVPAIIIFDWCWYV